MTPYYEDGGVTLYHGDCRDVLPQLGLVDHVLTDPPYAADVYVRASGPKTKKGSGTPDRIGVGSLAKLAAGDIGAIDPILVEVAGRIATMTRRWALVFSDAESTWRWRAALEGAGMRYVRTGAWVKPNAMPQMSGDRPAVGFEPATICHAQGPMRWNGGGHQALWTYGTASGRTRPDHPCPKPEALMCEIVAQFTDVDELIADPFAGSGTTLVAAKKLNRRAVGVELSEAFCELIARRCQQTLSLWAPADPDHASARSADLFT